MSKQMTTPKGVITIRPATVADAEPLYDLRLEALASHPEAFAADPDLTEARGVKAWIERMRQDEADNEGITCIASAGDELIGMTGLYRGHWPKTRHSGSIWGVYVKAEWRGRGIAKGLLEECIAWAQAQGVTIVKLGVVTTNTAAIRCYAHCGFAVYGVEPEVICHKATFYDELLMARVI